MHIVTKVLVVFAAILAVFLAALTIAYSSNADRIVASHNDEVSRRQQAEASLSAQAATHGTQLQDFQQRINSLNNELESRSAEIRNLQKANAEMIAARNAAEDKYRLLLSSKGELETTAKTQAALIASYRDETTTLRRNELGYRQRELEMGDRISDLEAKREVLDQSLRALQEQLAEARASVEAMASGVAAGRTDQPFTHTGPLIAGRVQEVTQDPSTGWTLVRVNVGTNDNVRENMKFSIARGDEFIGNVVVIRTDLNFSIARVDLLRRDKPVQIQPNDLVLSRLQ